jgi:hypothetical protein
MSLLDRYVPPVMRAASSGAAGRKGLVPKPAAGDQAKNLRGDGTWAQTPITFLGTVAGGSVPSTASAAGDWYYISNAGTSQSVTWAVGDMAVYKGSSGQWAQLPFASLTALLSPLRNALAPAPGLKFAGSAKATFSGLSALGSRYTVAFKLRADSLGTYNTLLHSATAGALYVYVAANGTLNIEATAGGSLFTVAAAVTVGQLDHFTITGDGSTMTVYRNGVSIGSTSNSTNFTAAITALGATASDTECLAGYIGELSIYNRALSATEVRTLHESAAPDAADYNSASVTSLVSGNDSTFGGAGNWVVNGASTISGGKLNLSDGDNCSQALAPVTFGRRLRFSVVVDSITAGTVEYYNGAAYVAFASGAGTYTIEFVGLGTVASGLNFRTTGGNAVLDTFNAYLPGLICRPAPDTPGNGWLWLDTSGAGAHLVLPTSGVWWSLPGLGANKIRGYTDGTTTAQKLHGATALLPATTQITRIRARSRTGTPSIILGTASGGSELVASVALSTTWKDLTIALTGGIVTAAAAIWITASAANVVEVDLAHEPLNY